MTSPFDPELSAVERMLHDRTRQTPSPALRSRVLASVDNVLPKTVPATKCGQDAQSHDLIYPDLVAGTFLILVAGTILMGTALSLLILTTLASEAASRRVSAGTDRPLLSFAQRAEAAGIALDVMPPSTRQLASGLPRDTAIPRHRDPFHVLDTRSFLQGDL
jgi:hypothetical protein